MQILVVMVVNIVVFHTEEYLSHGDTVRYNHVRGLYPVYSVSYLIMVALAWISRNKLVDGIIVKSTTWIRTF